MAMTVSDGRAGAAARVDENALRTNQALIVGFVVVAFVLGVPAGAWIVAAVAVALAIGALKAGSGPFQILYRRLLLPTGLVSPRPRADDPAQHRFAQVVGAACLAVSAILLLVGATVTGWALAWVVVALASVNLIFGFCAGCFLFLQLRRVGVVG